MTDPTWERVEQPILEAIASIEAEGRTPDSERIVARTGLDAEETSRALVRLFEADYISGKPYTEGGELYPSFLSANLAERGLRATKVWPSEDEYESLMQLIDDRLNGSIDPDERSKLQKVRDALGGATKEVAMSVLIAWVKAQGGL